MDSNQGHLQGKVTISEVCFPSLCYYSIFSVIYHVIHFADGFLWATPSRAAGATSARWSSPLPRN